MKWIGILNFIIIAGCTVNTNSNTQHANKLLPPCLWDKGIKEAITIAKLKTNPDEKRRQIIEYDKGGRPLIRKNPDGGDLIKFLYKDENLNSTIIQKSFNNDNELKIEHATKIDTNIVLKNDEFGRPLIMKGTDGNTLEYRYLNCEKDYQVYRDAEGNLIHQLEMTYENGILLKTLMKSEFEDWTEQVTNYFEYKLNEKGHWIERKYQYSSGMTIIEKRILTYY